MNVKTILAAKGGDIISIHPDATPLSLEGVPSNGDAVAVLELKGGVAKELGIVPGDHVDHPYFKNKVL